MNITQGRDRHQCSTNMRNVQSVLCGQSVAKQGTPVWPGRKTVSRYSLHQCFVVQFRPSNFRHYNNRNTIQMPVFCDSIRFFASWKVFSSEVWKLRIPVVCVVFENMCLCTSSQSGNI
jgi:hypothetical protein